MTAASLHATLLQKQISTATARAALIGAVLVESTGDDERPLLVLTKWAMCRAFTLEELPALERVLDLMGAERSAAMGALQP